MKLTISKILENKYLLWVVFGLTIVNVLGYLANNQFNSLTFLVCVGFLTSFFNKNMTVVLLTAIISTAFLNSQKIIEGLTNKEPEEEVVDAVNTEAVDAVNTEAVDEILEDSVAESGAESGAKPEAVPNQAGVDGGERAIEAEKASRDNTRTCYKKVDGTWKASDMVGDKCSDGEIDTSDCKGIDACAKLLQSGFSNMKSKNVVAAASSEARVDGKDDSIGNNIDSNTTLKQATNNLQGMLGKGGIKGLTAETKLLIEQQKELVNSLGQMAPILKSAKSTLDGLDMPDISGLTGLLKGLNGN